MNWVVYSFHIPLTTGGVREGLLLRWLDERGEHWGEIAPFPGRSKETLPQALAQLLKLLRRGSIEEELLPSVQFGLESTFLPFQPVSAPLYALLMGDPNTVLKQAETAKDMGHSTVKLKISSFPLAASHKIIAHLQKHFRLRIDCNSAFSYQEAMALFSPFDPASFDYIEDPTYELHRLPEFPYPFALDESVHQYQSLPLSTYRNLYGFILKPTILGGKKGCTPLIEYAQKHQLKVIFSPAFETGVGLLQILKLAQNCGLISDPIGLDTHRYLSSDILIPTVHFNRPQFSFNDVIQVHLDRLKEIAHGSCQLPDL